MAMYLRIQLCSNIENNADVRLIVRPKTHRICVAFGVESEKGSKSKADPGLEVKLASKACNSKI